MNVFLAVNGRMQAASFFLKCAIRIHPDTHEIHSLIDKRKKVIPDNFPLDICLIFISVVCLLDYAFYLREADEKKRCLVFLGAEVINMNYMHVRNADESLVKHKA